MVLKPSLRSQNQLNFLLSSTKTDWLIVDSSPKEKILTPLNNCWLFTKTPTFTSTPILMVVRKKRKRKSTPLKRKINTSIKKSQDWLFPSTLLMVLNYLILGKGNVTQTRKTCPSCGPGIFMAQHWDRYYCGLCHTTIKMDAETIKKNE